MNFYCRLMSTIRKCQKAINFSKNYTRSAKPVFFPCKSMKSEKFLFQLFLTTPKVALAAYTL